MSIIYEALKKVEGANNKERLAASPPAKTLEPSAKINKKNNKYALYILGILLFLFFLVNIFYLASFYEMLKRAAKKTFGEPAAKQKVSTQSNLMPLFTSKLKLAAEKTTAPAQKNVQPLYVLTGIIYDENNPFAIINGKMLKKADRIDGFEVIDISPAEVKLRSLKNGSTFSLSL